MSKSIDKSIDDEGENRPDTPDNPHFDTIVQNRLESSGRRGLFKGAAAAAVLGYVGIAETLAAEPKSGEGYARVSRRPATQPASCSW